MWGGAERGGGVGKLMLVDRARSQGFDSPFQGLGMWLGFGWNSNVPARNHRCKAQCIYLYVQK